MVKPLKFLRLRWFMWHKLSFYATSKDEMFFNRKYLPSIHCINHLS